MIFQRLFKTNIIAVIATVTLVAAVTLAVAWPMRYSSNLLEQKQKMVLWIWDKDTDLSYLNAEEYIIAPLMCTIYLQADGIRVEPRHHRFLAPASIQSIGVIRIESPRKYGFKLSEDHITQMVMIITGLLKKYNFSEIQIDFDAARSERTFYRQFLNHLRSRVPDKTTISITALASWFAFDLWWRDLPVDEIVFMFYPFKQHEKPLYQTLLNHAAFYKSDSYKSKLTDSMSLENFTTFKNFKSLKAFKNIFRSKQKISIGLSLQSPLTLSIPDPINFSYHRIFWFNYKHWNKSATDEINSIDLPNI